MGWQVVARPTIGEATVSLLGGGPERPVERRPAGSDVGDWLAGSESRSRRRIRWYAVHNRLSYMWSLTWRDDVLPDGPQSALLDCRNFVRRLRRARGGEAFPYVYVAEGGDGSTRLNAHMLLGQELAHEVVAGVWGRGWVWVTPPGGEGRQGARAAASYAAKYAGKELLRAGPGKQRYRLGEGFRWPEERLWASGPGEACRMAAARLGGPVETFWASSEAEGWEGPPTYWLQAR